MALHEPTKDDLDALVRPYLDRVPAGVRMGFVIGYASPDFDPVGQLYFAGSDTANGTPMLYDQQGDDLPLNGDTIFEIASITKTFTGTALCFQPRTQLSFPLGEIAQPPGLPYNPWCARQFREIPLSSLVNYTSGLPFDNTAPKDQPDDLGNGPYNVAYMRLYLNNVPNGPPPAGLQPTGIGARYTYSNLAFAMVGATWTWAIPDIGLFMKAQLFDACGMSEQTTGFAGSNESYFIPRGYNCHNFQPATHPSPVPAGWRLFPAYEPAGGIMASGQGMMQWLLANMNYLPPNPNDSRRAPLESAIDAAQTLWPSIPGVTDRASGWFVGAMPGLSSRRFYFKDGRLGGATGFIAFESKDASGKSPAGVFVLCNAHRVGMSGAPAAAGAPQAREPTEAVIVIAQKALSLIYGAAAPTDDSAFVRTEGSEMDETVL